MTSIFDTTRAQRFPRYRAWLLDVNLHLIMQTGRSLDEEPVHATSTWRWFKAEIQPNVTAWLIAAGNT